MKYRVTLYYHASVSVEVNAKTEEDAIEKAYDLIDDDDLLANLQEDDEPDVQQIR